MKRTSPNLYLRKYKLYLRKSKLYFGKYKLGEVVCYTLKHGL